MNSRVHNRALQLQSQGPDEFPFGYYYHLAQQELADEEKSDGEG